MDVPVISGRPKPPSRSLLPSLSGLDAHHRFVVSLVVALISSAVFFGRLKWGTHAILTWDTFSLCLLVLAWARMLTAQPKVVLRSARLQHTARKWIFLFVLAAACASLAAVFFLLRPAKILSPTNAWEHIALALATVLLSWALIHTIFALQYAYLFYCRHPEGGGEALIFPEGKKAATSSRGKYRAGRSGSSGGQSRRQGFRPGA